MNTYIRKKDIAAYALLPGIIPRFRDLFTKGFEWFACLIAHVFYTVRLLPAHHPYLKIENRGKFSVLKVLVEASRNIKFRKDNIDQIAIFGVILSGILLLVSQIFLLVFSLIFSQAQASGLFQTVNADSDAAFMLLDFVFGIPGFYGSCALGTPTGQTIHPCTGIPAFGDPVALPFHRGLHSLLEFYSWSLLFVAVIIFVYFIAVVTAETAQTGVPLGARFNYAWAPVRMLVAIGLLVPVVYGLNSGQYIVLAVAKLGSGLATNAWLEYNDVVEGIGGYATPNPLGENPGGAGGNESLLPRPNMPDASEYIAAANLIQTCRLAYRKGYGWDGSPGSEVAGIPREILPYAVKPGAAPLSLNGMTKADYQTVLDYYDKGDILIRFGTFSDDPSYPGTIFPYCGDLILPTIVTEPIQTTATASAPAEDAGAWDVQKSFFAFVLFDFDRGANMAIAARWVELQLGEWHRPCSISDAQMDAVAGTGFSMGAYDSILSTRAHNKTPGAPSCNEPPSANLLSNYSEVSNTTLAAQVDAAWTKLKNVDDLFALTTEVRERGWVAAGMWYNKIAAIIGTEFEGARALPRLSKYPYLMEKAREINGLEDMSSIGAAIYNPALGDNDSMRTALGGPTPFEISGVLYANMKHWSDHGIGTASLSAMADKNVLANVMHGIFGTRSLLEIRSPDNAEVHPMSLLVAIGKDLVDSTIRNVLISTTFAIGGGVYGAFQDNISASFLSAMSSAFSSIAMVGLTVGFLLYYVLPFMPFLYFFFAAGTWVKSIFEAMVGVPLWALAHLRIDKEGLPGDAAANGYFLILEIFIRPILIVFSLIASFAIFGALIRVLHEIFGLVVDNVIGFSDDDLGVTFGTYTMTLENKRAVIDEFFFTIIYTFMVYVTALSCFKLIDMIPNSILRWAGAGVKSFGDISQAPADGLTQYAAIGGYMVGNRVIGGLNQAGSGIGQGLGAAMRSDGAAPVDPFSVMGNNAARRTATPPPSGGSTT